MEQNQQPNQPQLQIKVRDEELKGAYSNLMQILHTKEEFVLDTDGAHARAFGKLQPKPEDIRLTPTTFVIDKNGRVILYKLGDFDFVKLQALLDKELS